MKSAKKDTNAIPATILMHPAEVVHGRRSRPGAESLPAEPEAALPVRPRLELLEGFDGGGSAMRPDHEKLRRALRRDEESLLLLEMGCLDEAEHCCREAMALFEELDGPEHPDAVNALQRLSAILCGQSRYQEAEACAERAASIMDRLAGERNWRRPNRLRSKT
jgi:tetratricopeptide (TPR) repeat protein